MAETEVKWLKMKVGMFDGNSFKKIKRAKIGGVSYRDKLTAIWFELLDLAGKSNRNGFLVDNNEIPYKSYEDIAIMLDREEKEVELCMQFFINEQMVEVVNKVYCITKFVEYQNTDGLEKIKEQKKLAQQRWRERKRLGLIGQNVDKNNLLVESTVESTDHLPSISNSISNNNIYNIWDKNMVCDCITNNGEKCTRRAVYEINGIKYCNQHSKGIVSDEINKINKRFIKPSIEEIKAYCNERNNKVDAQTFYDFYESKGWKVGNQPMKDWQACVRTWEKRDGYQINTGGGNGFPQHANSFTRNELTEFYSEKELEDFDNIEV